MNTNTFSTASQWKDKGIPYAIEHGGQILAATKLADFGPAHAEINQAVIEKLRANKIEIPFPQHEVRLLNEADAA